MSEYNLIVEDSIKNIGEKDYRKIWQADPHRNIFTSWDYLSILEQSIAMEYMRFHNTGQFCNLNNFGYFEITSAMASHDNGVFLKLVVSVINASGENFTASANNIKFSYGCLEIEKIAELAS